jgi:hypothetical protein
MSTTGSLLSVALVIYVCMVNHEEALEELRKERKEELKEAKECKKGLKECNKDLKYIV